MGMVCLTPEEREIAIGRDWVGWRGCYRIMIPLVEPFRRTTCSPACQMRVERRRVPKPPPPPTQTCAQCGHKFVTKHKDKAIYCSARCRHRAKDDRRLALGKTIRARRRLAHPAALAGR